LPTQKSVLYYLVGHAWTVYRPITFMVELNCRCLLRRWFSVGVFCKLDCSDSFYFGITWFIRKTEDWFSRCAYCVRARIPTLSKDKLEELKNLNLHETACFTSFLLKDTHFGVIRYKEVSTRKLYPLCATRCLRSVVPYYDPQTCTSPK
jgi:hypothetical protein